MAWDGTQDAAGNPASGSVRYEVLFKGAASEQFSTWFSIANRWGWDGGTLLDGTIYTNVAFDIKVDPSSALTPGGNYGWLEVSLVIHTNDNSWERATEKGMNIPLSATNWTRVNMPITITSPGLDKVAGFCFRMWSNGAHTNSLIFNLDNVAMEKPEVVVPIAPPTLSMAKAAPGLTFVAASGGQYDRQSIRTVGSNYSWIGASGPVNYSVNVAKLGQSDPAGFQLFMHFIPGGADPTRPDSVKFCHKIGLNYVSCSPYRVPVARLAAAQAAIADKKAAAAKPTKKK